MARLPRAMIAEAAREVEALGLRGSMAPVCPCGTTLPTGPDEPASGLCPTCEERDADHDAAIAAADDQAWRARERADEKREH